MSSSKQDQSIFDTLAARLDKDPGTPVNDPTESFWQVPRLPIADARSEQLPEVADVVVIGSGITGISTSLHLLRQDHSLKIVMLEARSAISGATGRNGGHIKAVPWADYYALKEEFGKESAMKITKFRLSHLDALVGEADALGEAGKVGLVRRVEGVSGVYDEEGWKLAKVKLQSFLEDFPEERGRWTICEDQAELNQLGLANAYGCIRGRSGAAWPYRLLGCVLSKMLSEGQLSLETQTVGQEVRCTRSTSHPYEVHTSRGLISTKHVIHCTNAYTAHLLPALKGKLWPLRGQMTVQSVPEAFPRVGGTRSWSAIWARGFDYITQSPAEDGSLYLGGGFLQGGLEKDQDLGSTDDSTLSAQCLEHLEAVPSKAFVHGTGAKVEKKWTGIMGFTGDGLPMVDRVRSHVSGREECEPNVGGEWIAAGWDGYGMVHCWLAGKALAAMVTGHEDEVRDWFPKDEFACSKERLDKMSAEGALERFFGSLTSENKR
ncbi:FAD dependent oxidoreductase-domain-containing protein [Exophiala viscosa]|uniref:FAD dependent oxidoreductase-domain-containing protein n=1 Tax=Exophiala viscosa TaxID=2486360 RepID=UPI002199FA4C|nr:FAD dependent oxidoreductase-domain-containing protein [Exophiala viscosa]